MKKYFGLFDFKENALIRLDDFCRHKKKADLPVYSFEILEACKKYILQLSDEYIKVYWITKAFISNLYIEKKCKSNEELAMHFNSTIEHALKLTIPCTRIITLFSEKLVGGI